MYRDDTTRLRHMLDAAREAVRFAEDRTRQDLDNDRILVLALVKELEIIGEAAYQISAETQAQLIHVPWNDIIGMRHRLVHAYFDINLDILWGTLEKDLPPLIETLSATLDPNQPKVD